MATGVAERGVEARGVEHSEEESSAGELVRSTAGNCGAPEAESEPSFPSLETPEAVGGAAAIACKRETNSWLDTGLLGGAAVGRCNSGAGGPRTTAHLAPSGSCWTNPVGSLKRFVLAKR